MFACTVLHPSVQPMCRDAQTCTWHLTRYLGDSSLNGWAASRRNEHPGTISSMRSM